MQSLPKQIKFGKNKNKICYFLDRFVIFFRTRLKMIKSDIVQKPLKLVLIEKSICIPNK